MKEQPLVELLATKIASEYSRPMPTIAIKQKVTKPLAAYAAKPWGGGNESFAQAHQTHARGDGIGQPRQEGIDPIVAAHLVIYGVAPTPADVAYWNSEMDRIGSFRDVIEAMSKSRGHNLIALSPDIARKLTAQGANHNRDKDAPMAYIVRSYVAFLDRQPTFGEIEGALSQIFRDNTGPIDIEYSLRERATRSDLSPISLSTRILKIGSWVGRRLFSRRFNLAPFSRLGTIADFRFLDHLKSNAQMHDDMRMAQVQITKLMSGNTYE